MPLKHFAATGLLAAVCFLGGCVILWDDPPDEPDEPDKPANAVRDSGLIGDWRTVYVNDDGAGIEITALAPSGGVTYGGFLKAGDFWIESWESIGTWRTSNDTLYEELNAGGADTLLYAISGNMVALRSCNRKTCDTAIAERVDIAGVRSALNTVYSQYPALFASAGYTDLIWRLEGGGDEIIDFDMMYFWNGERYFGDDWYYDQVWYTTDSDLFLIGMDSIGEVLKTVKLVYEITWDRMRGARLLIRPALEDGGLGPEDIWLPAECEDCYWNSPRYKSKQGKRIAKKYKKLFATARPPKIATE